MDLQTKLDAWGNEDLANLATILGLDDKAQNIASINDALKWHYHSKVRENMKGAVSSTWKWARSIAGQTNAIADTSSETELTLPEFEQLIIEASEHLGVFVKGTDLSTLEKYISEKVIAEALNKMTPRERHQFFVQQVDAAKLLDAANIEYDKSTGPKTVFLTLGLANAAGFGLYSSATTALGFATHAIGVTLPFAAYTGLSSTIAFVIGPAGWLAAGSWLAWKVTGPDWEKIIPALLYVVCVEERLRLQDQS